MKANEFILMRDNLPVKCSALSVLYSEDNNRGFVVYFDGTIENGKTVLKIGELKEEDSEIIIENLDDEAEINDIWAQFKDMYKRAIENGVGR